MSTTATPQAPPTENVYGIAKRISLDLEKLPLHTHAAIINIVNTMCQHRKIVLESEAQQAQIDAQEAAMADARKAHAEKQVARDVAIADQLKTAGRADELRAVSNPAKLSENQPLIDEARKPPRLSIVLDKPGDPSVADLDAVATEKDVAMQTALAEEVVAQ